LTIEISVKTKLIFFSISLAPPFFTFPQSTAVNSKMKTMPSAKINKTPSTQQTDDDDASINSIDKFLAETYEIWPGRGSSLEISGLSTPPANNNKTPSSQQPDDDDASIDSIATRFVPPAPKRVSFDYDLAPVPVPKKLKLEFSSAISGETTISGETISGETIGCALYCPITIRKISSPIHDHSPCRHKMTYVFTSRASCGNLKDIVRQALRVVSPS
jgi:hypothetical protein